MTRLFVFLFCWGLPGALLAQDEATLTATGTGEVRIEPDLAFVRLGVVAQETSARTAQQRVNSAIESIVKGVEALGVRRADVQTSQLSLQPVYSNRRDEENPRIVGYTASYTVTIRVERLDNVGPVLDSALASGTNRLDGVTFGLADESPHRRLALRSAVEDAAAKAGALAEAAGMKILGVLEISEGSAGVQPVERSFARMEALSATPVLPGQMTVSAQVTVRYRLGPR